MNIGAGLFLLLTAVMLALHLSIWKLLQKWTDSESGFFNRILSPRLVVRFEASYWLLAVLVLSTWTWSAWHLIVLLFAVIHTVVWLLVEWKKDEKGTALEFSAKPMKRAIVLFDSIEAVALVAMAWQTASFLSIAGT